MRRLLFLAVVFTLDFSAAAYATEVKEVVSPGGIKAWLVEEHALPLVSVKIAFRDAGAAYDPPEKSGLTAMAAAMLMEGAGDMDSRAFNAALENNAIQLNFGADDDTFRASVESLSEYREKAFSYLALALTQPRFDDSALERVRRQTLSIIEQSEHEPAFMVRHTWEKMAFGAHPYSRNALGTKDTVDSIGKDDLRHFVSHYLSRGNMMIAVVGDITPAELGKLLDAHLKALPENYAGEVTVSEVKLPTQAAQEVIENDIPQTMVLFGAGALKRDDPNYYASYVMNEILGGGGALTSKLGLAVRDKRGLAYSIYTQVNPMLRSAFWRGGFATRNDKVGSALDVVRAVLKDFAANGPTDNELAYAKGHLINSFVLGLDSNGDIANYLISMQLNHLGKDYLDKRNSYIAAVTKEQVREVARQLTDPKELIVVMVGKPNLHSDSTNASQAGH